MRYVLDLLYLTGYLLASPWLLRRGLRRRAEARGASTSRELPRHAVWLHGASVGEVTLLRPLIEMLERDRPGLPIVISAHTDTGVEAARKAYPAHAVFRLPADLSLVQGSLVERLNPLVLVVVESDLWPNQLLACERAGVPIAVINAKLSERSFRRHRLSRFVPRALTTVSFVAAQSAEHADRFAGLGVPRDRITVTGNMKYDLTSDELDAEARSQFRSELGFGDEDVVIVGGSLHLPEDEDLLAVTRHLAALPSQADAPMPKVRLIIVPRYPEQAAEVIANARRAGFETLGWSEYSTHGGGQLPQGAVLVVDVVGELRRFYGVADIAFVGGSLYYRGANKGGHNLMEPAILGLPVVFGPHNYSFRETVADLLEDKAAMLVKDRAELQRDISSLAHFRDRRVGLGRRARQIILNGQGSSARNLELLGALLDGASLSCSAPAQDAQCRHQRLESYSE